MVALPWSQEEAFPLTSPTTYENLCKGCAWWIVAYSTALGCFTPILVAHTVILFFLMLFCKMWGRCAIVVACAVWGRRVTVSLFKCPLSWSLRLPVRDLCMPGVRCDLLILMQRTTWPHGISSTPFNWTLTRKKTWSSSWTAKRKQNRWRISGFRKGHCMMHASSWLNLDVYLLLLHCHYSLR